MPLVFNSTSREFRSIGQQAMNGLVWGLNNGRGRVMSTARSIANSVASTMQNALKIKSPSGVMRDDVGRWIPEGVADGIEKSSSAVYDAIDKMNTGMLKMNTPELVLGAGSYGLTSAGSTSNLNRLNRGTTSQNTPQKTERNLSISIQAETKEPLDEAELLRRARLEAVKAGYEFQL